MLRKIKQKISDWWYIKVKLTIAEFIHYRTATCWAEMVSWAGGHEKLSDVIRRGDASCVIEAGCSRGNGSCYCGKYVNSAHGYDMADFNNSIDVNPDKKDEPPF